MTVTAGLRYGVRVARSGDWTERPPDTNITKAWDVYHERTGAPAYQRQPWCGAALTNVLRAAGWDDSPPNFISVYAIQSWAEANRRWRYGAAGIQPGDVLVLFGPGIHTGIARSAVRADGTILTEEGNTSPGSEGSQFNGGTFALKVRRVTDVYGVARTHDLLGTGKKVKHGPVREPEPQYRHEASRGSLHLWERGPRVAALQRALGIEDDGYYGRATLDAVAEFKKRHGLGGTGVVAGDRLHEVLARHGAARRPTPRTVHRGDKGAAVRRAQGRLNAHGAKLAEDGDYGPKTLRAVRTFQRRRGLDVTGVVNRATWRALGRG